MDLADLKAAFCFLRDRLDHRDHSDVVTLENAVGERWAQWICGD